MIRIRELADEYRRGRISAKAFRSALVAQISMLGMGNNDAETIKLAEQLAK